MVLTRAMVSAIHSKEEYAKAWIKLSVLETPGVASNIAAYLDPEDPAFKGLYLLVNSSRYRHELGPRKDQFLARRDRLLQLEHSKSFHAEIRFRLYKLRSLKNTGRYRCEKILQLYECIANQVSLVSLMVDLFASAYDQIDIIKDDVRRRRFHLDYKRCVFLRFDRVKSELEIALRRMGLSLT